MPDLEELKRKKEELLLKKEISKLERRERTNNFFNEVSYRRVIILALIGGVAFFTGVSEGAVEGVFFGLLLIFPLVMKYFYS